MSDPVDVDLYYDFRSPYAYLAAHRIETGRFAPARPIRWRWRAVSIDVLLNLQAGRAPLAAYADPLAAPKRRHLVADVGRCARLYEAPLRRPVPARPDPTLALCVATLLEEDGAGAGFHMAVFRALWEQQRDIADPAVLAAALPEPAAALLERARDPRVRQTLIANSQTAYDRGVFGVPSFVLGDEVYFGADRLDLLGARLGWDEAPAR